MRGRGMDDQTETGQSALALQSSNKVVGERHHLKCVPKHKLLRLKVEPAHIYWMLLTVQLKAIAATWTNNDVLVPLR